MAAKDGSVSFDFAGIYTKVTPLQEIAYKMADKREVEVLFTKINETSTEITETFDAEGTHTLEQQREGWQSILDSFKQHTETL